MKRKNVVILTVILVIVIAIGAWRFWLMFQEWKHTQEQLVSLEIQYCKTAQDLADSRAQIGVLNQKISTLEVNNIQLSKEKQDLEQKVTNLETEKQVIEAKLHSLKDLKQAIRQVKIEMHEQGVQEYLARKAYQKEMDAQELALGNRGFFIKDGQSTSKTTIKIEVKPAN